MSANKIVSQSEIRFDPVIGEKYYLYERKDKTTFLSLIPFECWNRSDLYFKGIFKLDSHDVWIQE